ncbi:unnamed protein product, partial [Urochloa humidicola]
LFLPFPAPHLTFPARPPPAPLLACATSAPPRPRRVTDAPWPPARPNPSRRSTYKTRGRSPFPLLSTPRSRLGEFPKSLACTAIRRGEEGGEGARTTTVTAKDEEDEESMPLRTDAAPVTSSTPPSPPSTGSCTASTGRRRLIDLEPHQALLPHRPSCTAPPRHGLASPLHHHVSPVEPAGLPEDPDYFDDVDYAEEEDKDNTSVCELQVRTWSSSPNV